MAKLQRYDSQAPIPVEKPVFARSMQYSQGISQGLGNLAQGIQNFAQNRQRQIEADRMVQEKYQAHLDSRNANLAKDAININAIELQGIYDSENDVTKWEALSKRKLNELRNRINPLLENVSEEQRQFIEDNVNYYEESEMAKMRSLRLKTIVAQNRDALSASYEQSLSNGDMISAALAEEAFISKYNDFFPTLDEAKLYLSKIKERGENSYNGKVMEDARDAVAGFAQSGLPDKPEDGGSVVDGIIGAFTSDASQMEELRQYYKSVKSSYQVSNKLVYEAFLGKTSDELFEKFNNYELEENDIWRLSSADVPEEYKSDFSEFKSQWVSRVRMRNDRILNEAKESEIEKRKQMYSPDTVAELERKAKSVESPKDVGTVKTQAIDSMNRGLIKEDDVKVIFNYADSTFKDAPYKAIDSVQKDLVDEMLRSYTPDSLAPWMQSQILIAKARGDESEIDAMKLIDTFTEVGKARQWIVNEFIRDMYGRVQPDKDKPQLSVSEVQEMALVRRRQMLRMSDTEIVEAYRQWLNK